MAGERNYGPPGKIFSGAPLYNPIHLKGYWYVLYKFLKKLAHPGRHFCPGPPVRTYVYAYDICF